MLYFPQRKVLSSRVVVEYLLIVGVQELPTHPRPFQFHFELVWKKVRSDMPFSCLRKTDHFSAKNHRAFDHGDCRHHADACIPLMMTLF